MSTVMLVLTSNSLDLAKLMTEFFLPDYSD